MFCLVGFVISSLWICVCVLIEEPNLVLLNFQSGKFVLVDFHA